MTKYDNPEVLIIVISFLGILVLGALLAEVAVWIAKLLGYEFSGEVAVWVAKRFGFDDPDPTDFIARLEAGEVLDKDNMFG